MNACAALRYLGGARSIFKGGGVLLTTCAIADVNHMSSTHRQLSERDEAVVSFNCAGNTPTRSGKRRSDEQRPSRCEHSRVLWVSVAHEALGGGVGRSLTRGLCVGATSTTQMQSVVRLKLAARRRKEVAYLRAVENEAARLEKQRSQLFAGAATVAQSLALSIVGNVDQASNANRKDDDDVLLVGSAAASSSSGDSAEPSAVAVSTAAPQQSETGGLPEGWVEDWDPVSGFPYYVNTHTGESRWERPTLAHRVRAVARFAVGGR